MTTESTAEQKIYTEVDLSELRLLPGGNQGDARFIVGNSSTGVILTVVALPVIIALVYAFIMMFMFTPWGELNLTAVTCVWLVLWVLLAVLTLAFGNTRHLYLWNVADQTITHLNSGETKPLDLKVELTPEGLPHIGLSDPLASGWHLPASIASLALTEGDSMPEIEEWQPSGLIESIKKSFTDSGTLWCILIPDAILLVLCFGTFMMPFFLVFQLWLLGAWCLAAVIGWLLEQREYRRWRNRFSPAASPA